MIGEPSLATIPVLPRLTTRTRPFLQTEAAPVLTRPIARLVLGLGVSQCLLVQTRAEHARITLDVAAPGGQQTAFVDQTPPPSGKNPRPVIKAKAGEPIRVNWTLTNAYPHKTLENVVVHFLIAREAKVGQKELPDPNGEFVVESAFEMDFKPGARVGQKNTVRIDEPGVYLIRVETRQTNSDHEHFSAIDLIVEKEAR